MPVGRVYGANSTQKNTGGSGGGLEELIASFDKKEEEARLANLSRENQVRAIYDEVIQRYQSGGAFEQAGERMIGQQKTQDVGARTQHAIGAGLYNTQGTGAIGQSWEQDVGSGMRFGMQDTMMQRLTAAQTGKADFITGIENRYPDANRLGGMSQQYGESSVPRMGERGESLINIDHMGGGMGKGNTPAGLTTSNAERTKARNALKAQYGGSTNAALLTGLSKMRAKGGLAKSQAEAYMAKHYKTQPTGGPFRGGNSTGTGAPTTTGAKIAPSINLGGKNYPVSQVGSPGGDSARYTPKKDTRTNALKGGAMFARRL